MTEKPDILAFKVALQRALVHAPAELAVPAWSAATKLIEDYSVLSTGARDTTISEAMRAGELERELRHLTVSERIAAIRERTGWSRSTTYNRLALSRRLNKARTA